MNMKTAQRYYDRLPILLQNLALTVYGLRVQHDRYGGPGKRFAEELREHERWTRERSCEEQMERLRRRALIALQRVPAYRGLSARAADVVAATSINEILDVFPILTKDEIRTSPERYVPEGIGIPLLQGLTGGTTGKPLRVFRTAEGVRRNFSFFRQLREWHGIPHESPTATIAGRLTVQHTQDRPPYWRHAWLSKNMLFSSFHISPATLPAYVGALRRFRPMQVVCYPSSGTPIAEALLRHGGPLESTRAVFTTAETLAPEQRDVMERAFGCRVVDMYGSAEWTVWVSQCREGSYHVHPEYGILELLDEQNRRVTSGSGRVVSTNLINDAMYLVRYDTGDLATVPGPDCPCGLTYSTLASVEGRREEHVVTPDGRRVGRLNNFTFLGATGVVEGQLVQTALDHLEVRVVPGPDWGPSGRDSILGALRARLGDGMRVEIVTVESIPRTESGKFRAVIGLPATRRAGSSIPA